jgi:hypothetical protein
MEYNRIVAVTGISGLFEVVSSKSDGAIVRSLEDQSTKFISSRVHNLSHLESIEVYTVRDNVSLADILSAMKESKEKLPDAKDNKALKAYFEKVYPDLDFERVYSSDLKKMVKWYEVLQQNNVDFTAKTEEEPTEETAVEAPAEPVAEKKTKTKKAPAAETEAKASVETKEKPKAPRKKKTEE